MTTDNERYQGYFGRIQEAIDNGETDTKLGRALARWKDHEIVIWRDGKWLFEGFVMYAKKMAEIFSAIDPTIPPDVRPHMLDPVQIAYFFGIPLQDFNWTGPTGHAEVATALRRIEGKLDRSLGGPRPEEPESEYVSLKRAASLTGLSYSHVRRAVLGGELPASNLGSGKHSAYRIARKDLTAWMDAKKGGTTAPPKSETGGLIERYFG